MTSGMKRRDFLTLMGMSGAAATMSCGDATSYEETWKPWVRPHDGMIPYVPQYYATSSREAGDGGMWIKVVDGRAIKAEGNPNHPINSGGLNARSQSVLQGLYGSGRIKAPRLKGGKEISWFEARNLLKSKLDAAKGKHVHALTDVMAGANLEVWSSFVGLMGEGRVTQYQAFNHAPLVMAGERVFGQAKVPMFHIADTDLIVGFGAQFLESWGPVEKLSREFGNAVAPENGLRAKFVQIEPKRTGTGANADQWLAVIPGSETAIALALLGEVSAHSANLTSDEKSLVSQITKGWTLDRASELSGIKREKLQQLADELSHAKSAVVLPGEDLVLGHDALKNHVAVLLLNKAVGAIGPRVDYAGGKSIEYVPSHEGIAKLLTDMSARKVEVLITKDVNPAYSLPADCDFPKVLTQVGFSVAFADTENETTALADLVIPVTHDLESWGEFGGYEGIRNLQQPVMTTRFEAPQAEDVLMALCNEYAPDTFAETNFRDYLKRRWLERFDQAGVGEAMWTECLKNGGLFAAPELSTDIAISANLAADSNVDYHPYRAGALSLVINESLRFGDGKTANRGWMQELPDAMTGVVWGSWLEISETTAKANTVETGDVVDVRAGNVSVELPVFISSTIRDGVVAMATGQGHTHYGDVYHRGANAFALITQDLTEGGQFAAGPMAVSLNKSGKPREKVVTTHVPGLGDRISQPLTGQVEGVPISGEPGSRDRDVYQSMSLNDYQHGGGDHGHGHHSGPSAESLFPVHVDTDFYPDRSDTKVFKDREETFYDDYKWEMSVDLNRCNGCGACVTACYAENNLPVMGKDQVGKGREMAWVRVNRYVQFHRDGDEIRSEVAFMPMMCQQCGNAPCESVCPSLATYHNREGLNAMVYNRCVGTRYCANNCTYKVRRFNWFDPEFDGDMNWALNPSVSARKRGVMEKCTFCSHRIRDAKDVARDEGRKVRDGEVKTACQQACPANAIEFGNAMDEQAIVTHKSHEAHAYRSLDDHIHTKPAISYLKKITLSNKAHS